jgi:predicted MFS family arabinose efflux permease
MIPAPWIYMAALGLGVALGVALDAWLGWPWWAVTLAVMAAVWLLLLSSAFTGPARATALEGSSSMWSVQGERRSAERGERCN